MNEDWRLILIKDTLDVLRDLKPKLGLPAQEKVNRAIKALDEVDGTDFQPETRSAQTNMSTVSKVPTPLKCDICGNTDRGDLQGFRSLLGPDFTFTCRNSDACVARLDMNTEQMLVRHEEELPSEN